MISPSPGAAHDLAARGRRIRSVRVRVAERTYASRFRNPHHAWTTKSVVLAFVETEGGALGVGEAWCDSGATRSVAALIADDLAPRIAGGDVSQPERLWAEMTGLEVMSVKGSALYAAVSAVDTAIWDAVAQSVGLPLHRLLGGARDSLPAYGSSGLYADDYGPGDLADDMAAAMTRGFCGVKIKAAGAPLVEDVARVAAVREAVGPDARLMVDALFTPDVPRAKRLARALAPYDLLVPGGADGSTRLTRMGGHPSHDRHPALRPRNGSRCPPLPRSA